MGVFERTGVDVGGASVGTDVGRSVGAEVGCSVVTAVGAVVGTDIGALVGADAGVLTGAEAGRPVLQAASSNGAAIRMRQVAVRVVMCLQV
jgi:hypothetical protein